MSSSPSLMCSSSSAETDVAFVAEPTEPPSKKDPPSSRASESPSRDLCRIQIFNPTSM